MERPQECWQAFQVAWRVKEGYSVAMRELFLDLSPAWVLEAVEAAGLEPTGHVMALHCLENRVYDLKLEDDSHVVAKFYRPGRWSKAAIEEEHQFLYELQEAELPVCAPLSFDGGSVHEVEGIFYAIWPRTGGRAPEELSDDEIAVLGRLLARMHNVGAARPAKHRRVLGADSYVREPLSYLEAHGFLPPQWAKRYCSAALGIAEQYEALSEGVPTHRIHGDCHRGNLLNGRDGWFFLDFDDFLTGPAVQDVWLLVADQDAAGVRARTQFIEAYQQFRDFNPAWLRLVEPLRALRYIHYAAWVARRWKDPAFPPAFVHFNTESYWERETLDLESQLKRILGAEA